MHTTPTQYNLLPLQDLQIGSRQKYNHQSLQGQKHQHMPSLLRVYGPNLRQDDGCWMQEGHNRHILFCTLDDGNGVRNIRRTWRPVDGSDRLADNSWGFCLKSSQMMTIPLLLFWHFHQSLPRYCRRWQDRKPRRYQQ